MTCVTYTTKNSKIHLHLKHALHQTLIPRAIKKRYKNRCYQLLKDPEVHARIFKRVNYYNRISSPFTIAQQFETPQTKHTTYRVCHRNLSSIACPSAYRYDTAYYLSHFPSNLIAHLLPGDIIEVPTINSLVKSRPTALTNNQGQSILLKLNTIRHFKFVNDPTSFTSKKPKLVWRGTNYKSHRTKFLNAYFDHPLIDAAQVNNSEDVYYGDYLSIPQQLNYKFILSIEGNDVATNLKWIMSSNSLCFMTRPKFETWFMEGLLIPEKHYVLIKDDYSDLQEKMAYYNSNPDQAEMIIQNANDYCHQFLNRTEEDLISFLVLEKFFHFSGQMKSQHARYF